MYNLKAYLPKYILPILLLPVLILCYEPTSLLFKQWGSGGSWKLIIAPVAVIMWVESLLRQKTFSNNVSIIPFCSYLCFTVLLTVIAYLSCFSIFSELAISSILVSVIWMVAGNGIAAKSVWPIGYFIGMVTISARIVPLCAPYFQYFSAFFTEHLLNILGFVTIRDGLLLRLPATTLRVGFWCSGANQLISLLALAIPLAFFRHRKGWKQALLISSALPIAMIFNIFRIVLIALWNYSVQRNDIHGPGEILLIPIIHPFAIAGLVGLSLLMDKNAAVSFLAKGSLEKMLVWLRTAINSVRLGKQWYFIVVAYVSLLLLITCMRLLPETVITLPKLPGTVNGFTEIKPVIPPELFKAGMLDTLTSTSYLKGGDTITVMVYALKKQMPARSLLLNVFENEENWENKSTFWKDGTPPFSAMRIQFSDKKETVHYSAFYWYVINNKYVARATSLFLANIKWWFGNTHPQQLMVAVMASRNVKTETLTDFAQTVYSQMFRELENNQR